MTAPACRPTGSYFEGFLPPRETARRARIGELAALPATLVLFETGPRIAAMLDDLAAGLGARPAAVCRELTKLHEEIRRGDLDALARKPIRTAPKPAASSSWWSARPVDAQAVDAADLDAMLRHALATASLKDAVEAVAAATGEKRRHRLSARAGA